MAKKIKLTEVKPEKGSLDLSLQDEKDNQLKNTLRMFAASCDREIQRIKTESAVRIGDSILNEAGACDIFIQSLQELKKNYSI
jgi:hypothetical protein